MKTKKIKKEKTAKIAQAAIIPVLLMGILALSFCEAKDRTQKNSEGSIYELDLTFQNQNAVDESLVNLKGSVVVFSLMYAHCKSICPLVVGDMLRIQSSLSAAEREKVKFVLINIDSKDEAKDLKDFEKRFKLDKKWILLRGDEDTIRELTALLGYQYRKLPDGEFSHSAAIYILDDSGNITFKKDGTGLDPNAFVPIIRKLL